MLRLACRHKKDDPRLFIIFEIVLKADNINTGAIPLFRF